MNPGHSYVRSNGIKNIKSAPFYATTNGMAERFVQRFKKALHAALTKKKTISRKLTNFLLAYRAGLFESQLTLTQD